MRRVDRSVGLYYFAIDEIIKLSVEEAKLIVDSDFYDENETNENTSYSV